MTVPLPETEHGLIAAEAFATIRDGTLGGWADVVGMGPGIGEDGATAEVCHRCHEGFRPDRSSCDADGFEQHCAGGARKSGPRARPGRPSSRRIPGRWRGCANPRSSIR